MAGRQISPTRVGRYAIDAPIAMGGMASIHLGRLVGEVGFARTVAVKRMHPHYTTDDEFVGSFLDEARMCARVRHTNVVSILDVVRDDHELFLVMEYLDGVSLLELLSGVHRRSAETGDKRRVPPPIVAGVMVGILHGLHAAHEACADDGSPLQIVHRDVSPANIFVGADGVPRLIDFGVAKALGRLASTRDGHLKGKVPYMSPEQISGESVDRRTDVFAAAVVLWEALTHRRLFHGGDSAAVLKRILDMPIEPPSRIARDLTPALDEVVLRGLERDPARRFQTAAEMADALEAALAPATARTIGLYIERIAEAPLAKRRDAVRRFESNSERLTSPAARPVRKRRARTFALAALAAGALVSGAVLAWAAARHETTASAEPASLPAAGSAVAAIPSIASPPTSAEAPVTSALTAASATTTVAAPVVSPAASPTPTTRRMSGRASAAPSSPAGRPSSVSTATALPLYGRK